MSELDEQIANDEAARNAPLDPITETVAQETQLSLSERAAEDQVEEDTDAAEQKEEFEKRIARLAYQEREARKQAKALQERLDRLEGKSPALPRDQELEALAEQKAIELAQVKVYNDRANAIYKAGCEAFPDFAQKLDALKEVGNITVPFVEAVDETGDAEKILYYLGKNPDEAQRIMDLPAHRMGTALGKLAARLAAPPAPKPQSKAPAPIKPISGKARAEQTDEQMPIDEYMRREDARTRIARYGR
jgi:hypothetical protein